MSSTRRATSDGPMRQERFCSSQEFERGLMGNLVARRCTILDRADDRELVWFLQNVSHQDGGLKQFAAELCQRYAARVATPAMQHFGSRPGQIYNAKQVEKVREEMDAAFDYPLRGECSLNEMVRYTAPFDYPAAVFAERCCKEASDHLEKHLAELCLNPALPIADGQPWYFPTLISTLREAQAAYAKENQPRAVTSIGKAVCDALDYTLDTGRLALVDGETRMGKSFAAKAWYRSHAGRARYVELMSTNDDIGFFRQIAKSIGVSSSLSLKGVQVRERVEETLQSSRLMLVIDEAHYLWPQSRARQSTPGRINWLMTALVNRGVPVALVTTPQFMRSQKDIEARTAWTSAQFIGRIGHYEKLPASLTADELKAVALALLPDGDAKSIEALTEYARASAKYLAGMDAVVARAQFIVHREQRETISFSHIKRAIRESVIPCDGLLAAALQAEGKPARKRAVRVSATPPHTDFSRPIRPLQMPINGEEISSPRGVPALL